VDVDRLRSQFPALTDEDVEAYVAVTRRILSARDPADRARITRDTLARGRSAGAAASPDDEDRLAVRYVAAVARMQGN
jgi:hypothetical protein